MNLALNHFSINCKISLTLVTRGFFLACDEELCRPKGEDISGKAARKNLWCRAP